MDLAKRMRELHLEVRDLKAELDKEKHERKKAQRQIYELQEFLSVTAGRLKSHHHNAKEMQFDDDDPYLLKADASVIEYGLSCIIRDIEKITVKGETHDT